MDVIHGKDDRIKGRQVTCAKSSIHAKLQLEPMIYIEREREGEKERMSEME